MARPRRRTPRASLGERARLFLPLRSLRVQLVGIVVAIILALSAHSFASAQTAAGTYLVKPGETLSGIATATGVSLERLITLNSLKNPDLIVVGQELQLAAAQAEQTASYAVKAGDTLWEISLRTGVPIETLISINDIRDADRLKIGQKLVLGSPTQRAASRSAASLSNALQQRVIAEARRVGGQNIRLGVAARNLTTGERVIVNADESFPSASVMKLPILVELERQVATGKITWTAALRTQAGAMIAVSDNAAANQLASLVGQNAVNDTMARLGLSSTRLVNPFSDARNRASAGGNRTSPADMASLLELIASDQLLNAQVSGDIRQLLARNNDRSKLVRLLPADARIAHKSGWYEGVANDVGIVTVDRSGVRWVIAVLAENVGDTETGNQVVAAVSKAVYEAWAK